MAKSIYLHIGLDKNASAAIQSGLMQNRDLLAKRDCLYPLNGVIGFAHDNIAYSLIGNYQFSPILGDIEDLSTEIRNADQSNIIISSEYFAFIPIQRIRWLFEKLAPIGNTYIIIYLRRQDLWLISSWAELVKVGMHSHSVEDFIKKREGSGYYYDVIQPWADVFGRSAICVKVLEKDQINDHEFLDFLTTCGMSETEDFVIPSLKNITPGDKALNIIRHLNQKLGSSQNPPHHVQKLSHQITKAVMQYANENGWDETETSLIDFEQRSQIMALFEDQNQRLAKEFLGREKLFHEPIDAKPINNIDDLTGSEALDLMSQVLSQLRTADTPDIGLEQTSSSMRPPLFIFGPPRSGSTFFVTALNEHEEIFVTNELRIMSFINDLFNRFLFDSRLDWSLQPPYKDGFLAHFRKEMKSVIQNFYLEHMPDSKAVWGDKHPHYADPENDPKALNTISEVFPNAQFIQIYRNPRAVIHSLVSKKWVDFEQAVHTYKLIFTTGREFGKRLGSGRYLEVKYENLVTDGVKVMGEICGFLNLPQSQNLIAFMEHQETQRTPIAEPITPIREIGKDTMIEFSDDEERLLKNELGEIMEVLKYA